MKTVLGENLYSSTEVAKILGVTTTTISNYIKQSKLKATTIGGTKYISEANLKAFVSPQ